MLQRHIDDNRHAWILYYEKTYMPEPLSKEEYKKFMEAIDAGSVRVILEDGRILSCNDIQRLIRNPEYTDPQKSKKLRRKYKMRREYLDLKEQGKFDKIGDFIDWKKQQLNKMEEQK